MLEGVMLIMVVHGLIFEFAFARCREIIFYSSYLQHGHWQVETPSLLLGRTKRSVDNLIVNHRRARNLESKFKLLLFYLSTFTTGLPSFRTFPEIRV